MKDAPEVFSRTSDNSTLKEIHFVENYDESCLAFVRKFHEKFGGWSFLKKNQKMGGIWGRFSSPESSLKIKESEKEEPDVAVGVLPRRSDDNFIITPGNMKILVAVGDLSTYQVMHTCTHWLSYFLHGDLKKNHQIPRQYVYTIFWDT